MLVAFGDEEEENDDTFNHHSQSQP